MSEKKDKTEITAFYKSRFLINISWVVALAITLLIYYLILHSPRASDILLTDSWYNDLLFIFIPWLVIQGVLHFLILKHHYPRQKIQNFIRVFIVSVLYIIGYAMLLATVFAQAIIHLR
jgi:hypothetical protein